MCIRDSLYTLAPGLEPQYLDLMLMRHTGDAADIPARSLMLTAEDGAAYDTVLALSLIHI